MGEKLGYYRQFEDFEPKEGYVPSHPFSLLPDIARRARQLLTERNSREIQAAAEMIDWILEDNLERETDKFINEQIENGGWAKEHIQNAMKTEQDLRLFVNYDLYMLIDPELGPYCPNNDDQNEVTTLKTCIESYDISVSGFSNGEDYECFSVLALWMLADSLDWLSRQSYSLAGEYALKAMDAVSYAERLVDTKSHHEIISHIIRQYKTKEKEVEKHAEKIAARRRSENARKGAAKRHEEHAMLRQDALEHYEKHKDEYRSIEDAARHIAEVIVPVKHRTVAKWISDHRKLQSASKM